MSLESKVEPESAPAKKPPKIKLKGLRTSAELNGGPVVDLGESPELVRSIAPEVGLALDIEAPERRIELLEQLDAAYPDFTHSYQSPNVGPWELEVKHQEVVKVGGRTLQHGGDPVVRQPRAQFLAARKAECKRSRKSVEAVVKNPKSTVYRRPKTPVGRDED